MTEFQDSEVLSVASVCEVWSGVSPTAWSCSLGKATKIDRAAKSVEYTTPKGGPSSVVLES